jgi:DNA repair protein RecO (recombination protein O)
VSFEDVRDGFRLTEFFFNRDVYLPRGIKPPRSRAAFIASVAASS